MFYFFPSLLCGIFLSNLFVHLVTIGNVIWKLGKRTFVTQLGHCPFNASSLLQEVHLSLWKLCCSIPPVKKSNAFLSKNPVHGKIVGVGSVESSFLFQTTRCIDSFDHPDLAPIMVFLECLTTLEVSYPGSPGCSLIHDQCWGVFRINYISGEAIVLPVWNSIGVWTWTRLEFFINCENGRSNKILFPQNTLLRDVLSVFYQ